MQFRTIVEIPPFGKMTGYRSKNFFLGSCFTENIGGNMQRLCFDTDINPFGILYNPVSIARSLQRLLSGEPFTREELFQHNGLWHSFMHHGRFSHASPEMALQAINDRFIQSAANLRTADFLFITLGTAWIYELKSTGKAVANCHKVPANEFRRFRLTVQEAVEHLKDALEALFEVNPGLHVVVTVSPIRHLKDGANGNQVSKSVLLLASDALVRGFGTDRCSYFPSYEIVNDELRDYRFYAEDMTHLSDVAIRYIWSRFSESLIDSESREMAKKIESIIRAVEHRPFNRLTPEHLTFLQKTGEKVIDILNNNPYIQLLPVQQWLQREMEDIRDSLQA